MTCKVLIILPQKKCKLLTSTECRLVDIVVKVMGDVFPELKQHEVRIREIIADEEASFGKTLLKVSMFCPFGIRVCQCDETGDGSLQGPF